jgi:hypothetical protein
VVVPLSLLVSLYPRPTQKRSGSALLPSNYCQLSNLAN